jgi:hypothetical protein
LLDLHVHGFALRFDTLTEEVDAASGGSADEYRQVRISGEELFETLQSNGKSFKQTNGKQSAIWGNPAGRGNSVARGRKRQALPAGIEAFSGNPGRDPAFRPENAAPGISRRRGRRRSGEGQRRS